MSAALRLQADLGRWPLREPFAISRHVFVDSLVLTVHLHQAGATGRGECEPHEHDQIAGLEAHAELLRRAHAPGWLDGLTRATLLERLPCTPLRNALDCALWDLEAKRAGCRAWALDPALAARVGLACAVPLTPTVALDTPQRMAAAAAGHRGAPYLKLKLGAPDGLDGERLEAVAAGFGGGPLVVDVNGGWTAAALRGWLPLARRLNVAVLEQPLPPGADDELPPPAGDLRFCADESCTDRESLPRVAGSYQMINVKLDKSGGLTEALALVDEATRRGLAWMVGSNGGTSLAMAPLYLLAHAAVCVDAGAGHLVRDREPPLDVRQGWLYAPSPALWG
jgi:L-alanine-DL-glutamate epimerase-like enolase superfamily enzyme